MDELKLSTEIETVEPEDIYQCWLDGELHAEMTGAPATGSAEPDAEFTAWGGYISGKNVELEAPSRILQSWRTSEFPDDAKDSVLEVTLTSNGDGGTIVTLHHWDIPDGDGPKYTTGWEEHYFNPMREYFGDEYYIEDGLE